MDDNEGLKLPDVPPKTMKQFKVVQLRLGRKEFICFDGAYHCFVLENFLNLHNVPFEWIYSHREQITAPKGVDYEVIGMGFMYIDTLGEKLAIFSGQSVQYGLGINCQQIQAIQLANPDWKILCPEQ